MEGHKRRVALSVKMVQKWGKGFDPEGGDSLHVDKLPGGLIPTGLKAVLPVFHSLLPLFLSPSILEKICSSRTRRTFDTLLQIEV